MSEGERIEAILNAAYACFTRHGVRRTTMDDIAREAGMSRPAVYQYVRNKEDAFRRLAERLLTGALAGANDAVAGPGDLTERLTEAMTVKLRLALKVWHDSPAHAAELLGDNARSSADLIESYDVAMLDILAGAVDAPGGRELAELLLALTRGIEADLSDPDAPVRRLRHGVALLVAGFSHMKEPS